MRTSINQNDPINGLYADLIRQAFVDGVGEIDIFQLLPLNCKKKREIRNISIFAIDYYNLIYGRLRLKQVKFAE